ncbi:MAG: M50 family metallopeptidase [Nocardioides sp.]|uniref:M50 family metallopeptidase n=1 Tax=Nocardioides sp. TaxID=35761 RepID=UPI0039E23BF9
MTRTDLGTAWSQLLDRAGDTSAIPAPPYVVAAGALALGLIWFAWRWVRLGVTVVHEAGHALVAVLVGRRLSGIRLHADTSGVTVSRGKPHGPGMIVMLAAGYLAPVVLGVLAALLLETGHARGLLWLGTVLLVVLALWIRNVYGLLVVTAIGAGLALLGWYADRQTAWLAAAVLTWILLLAAPRPLVELLRAGPAGRRGADPDQLARISPLPTLAWIWLLLMLTLAGVAVGVVTLLPGLANSH